MTEARSLALMIGAKLMDCVCRRGGEPVFDNFLTNSISRISASLTGDRPPLFMIIQGNVGNGKTTMLEALRGVIAEAAAKGLLDESSEGYFYNVDSIHKSLSVVTAKQIVKISRQQPDLYHELLWRPLLAIDELGAEPRETLDFGNCSEPLVTLIEERYRRQRFTAIATNLDIEEISRHYGVRIADRLSESSLRIIYGSRSSYRS